MKQDNKTFIGGLVAIILGASCCWISTLVVYLGGASFLGFIASYLQIIQVPLILLGALILLITLRKNLN